ncbi:hypothetical protein [Candidatus Uabimicrobium amorphum]|uniref:Peptidase S74 domain-containing protein n=1 Tax=Uabimicrobium amorphum TaxID=2596890 RepID=A0A5S9F516_UABAM|nr:hypothetical protein [Candidatus Uabimicrobium amorphum]BBM86138.1 hypothetical protein UABAM_04524 [Candidatus Uabimicrobium amorphum]
MKKSFFVILIVLGVFIYAQEVNLANGIKIHSPKADHVHIDGRIVHIKAEGAKVSSLLLENNDATWYLESKSGNFGFGNYHVTHDLLSIKKNGDVNISGSVKVNKDATINGKLNLANGVKIHSPKTDHVHIDGRIVHIKAEGTKVSSLLLENNDATWYLESKSGNFSFGNYHVTHDLLSIQKNGDVNISGSIKINKDATINGKLNLASSLTTSQANIKEHIKFDKPGNNWSIQPDGTGLIFKESNDKIRFAITRDGNVGINHSNPESELHIRGGHGGRITFGNAPDQYSIGMTHQKNLNFTAPGKSTNFMEFSAANSSITINNDTTINGKLNTKNVTVAEQLEATTANVTGSLNTAALVSPHINLEKPENKWGIEPDESGSLQFHDRRTKRTPLVIDKLGRIGVGINNPLAELHLGGAATKIAMGNGYGRYAINMTNDKLMFTVPGKGVNFLEFSGDSKQNAASNFYSLVQTHGNDIRLHTDEYHGIGVYNKVKTFEHFVSSGPVVYGATGGALGTTIKEKKVALQWNDKNEVGINCKPQKDFNLAVKGKIKAEEIEVSLDDWSDFVFNDNYPLMSLDEVEKQIKKNRHLPDIPSETEVIKNGIAIGKMQAKLLQKIEELTLYTIQQNKQIKTLQKQNKRIHSLEQEKDNMQQRLQRMEKMLNRFMSK